MSVGNNQTKKKWKYWSWECDQCNSLTMKKTTYEKIKLKSK